MSVPCAQPTQSLNVFNELKTNRNLCAPPSQLSGSSGVFNILIPSCIRIIYNIHIILYRYIIPLIPYTLWCSEHSIPRHHRSYLHHLYVWNITDDTPQTLCWHLVLIRHRGQSISRPWSSMLYTVGLWIVISVTVIII